MSKRVFVAFDERAADGDTEDASVLVALGDCNSVEEAITEVKQTVDYTFVLFSYADNNNVLTDDRLEGVFVQ